MSIPTSATQENAVIIPPCFIGENVILKNSVVGPHVSLGDNSVIENSIVENCIIQNNAQINNAVINNSMLGKFTKVKGKTLDLSVSDYSTIEA